MPSPNAENEFVVHAEPTKRFFVGMLTRDIELEDAILDLLDNCLDGVLRTTKGVESDQPYDGFWAKITIKKNQFVIHDNCGGIPKDILRNEAFRMGRLDFRRDARLPTVGVYGIGMKRAMFKMGQYMRVVTQTRKEALRVVIPPKWLLDEHTWTLKFDAIDDQFDEPGTRIEVSRLYPSVARRFRRDMADRLRDVVAQHYSVIIRKGFVVHINGKSVMPRPMTLMHSLGKGRGQRGIAPYVFRATLNGVRVYLAVGFYRPTPDEDEVERELDIRHSKEDAGWTVVCNDRVVLYRDKSRLTGWGEGAVPAYHSQFIAIAGIVTFDSNDAEKLPITTTKRGIDANSDVYLQVRAYMMEGMKYFTRFTNRWKRRDDREKAKALFKEAVSSPATEFGSRTSSKLGRWVDQRAAASDARKFVPNLPEPRAEQDVVRMTFTRPPRAVEAVTEFLFDTSAGHPTPNEVAGACFDECYERARSA